MTFGWSYKWWLLLLFLFISGISNQADAQNKVRAAFDPRRSIGFSGPFANIIHSKSDNSIILPEYNPWDNIRDHKIIEDIKSAGFDTVRLVVEPAGLLTATEAERQQIYKNFDSGIIDILKVGLNVVFDMHVERSNAVWNTNTLVTRLTDQKFHRYNEVIGSVAHFISLYEPNRVALELFNEPPTPCHSIWGPQWSDFQKKLFGTARLAAPHHTIVVTGPCGSIPEGIDQIDPKDYDANVIYTIHFYFPGVFSFQGAYWMPFGPKFIRRLPYPPTTDRSAEFIAAAESEVSQAKDLDPANRARAIAYIHKYIEDYFKTPMDFIWIKGQLAPALRWADKHNISRERIWVGEFGTMRDAYGVKTTAMEDRLRWISDVRQLFDDSGITWSMWCLFGGMGIATGDKSGPPDPRILTALGIKAP